MGGLQIGQRLLAGFGLVILLAVLLGVVAVVKMNTQADIASQMYDHPLVVSNAVREIKANINAMDRFMKDIALSRSKEEIDKAAARIQTYEQDTLRLFGIVTERFLGDPGDVDKARRAFMDWRGIREEIIALTKKGDTFAAASATRDKSAPHMDSIDKKMQIMVDFAGKTSETFYRNAERTRAANITTMLALVLATAVLGIAISWTIARSITAPLEKLIPLATDVADGSAATALDNRRSDEVGRIIECFNSIVASNNMIMSQARALSLGDYSQDINLRSEKDELGRALQGMTTALRESGVENRRQNWIKTGQNELNEKMLAYQDIAALSNNIITFLSKYLGVQVGALYLYHQEEQELRMTGSYAFTRRKQLGNVIRPGEGLVGQAALEREIISVTDLPEDYTRIASAIGDTIPRNVVVMPLKHAGTLTGIIELGTVRELSDQAIDFLHTVAENISIALDSATARKQMEALLTRTQQQTEDLRAGQEELRQTNEELAEQTGALRASEEKLQAQQEELRQTNEELQEQTRLLGEQKTSIQNKNRELETARKLIEEKARDLEMSSKYKSEFLANMSHELRTPLNSILLLSKMLAENKAGRLTQKQTEFARTINSSGTELMELINEILDLSKIESGKFEIHNEAISLKEFTRRMERHFKHLAQQKNIAFSITISPESPEEICTDRQRLEQIIKNLLSNAFKFTTEGQITLSVGRPAPQTRLPAGNHPEKTIAFNVSDTGTGISVDNHKNIFEAFQQADGTTSRKYGGTGLGLAISRELAGRLGGDIHLESEPGQGSTFTLFLPENTRQENSAPAPDTARQPIVTMQPEPVQSKPSTEPELIPDDRKKISPGDKAILIVEDDPNFAKTLCELSRERDFRVLVAGDGETGLHFADYYRPSAVILDIDLPGMDGWEVMARLKENAETRHIPVHFISGYDKEIDARKMGAIGYITKPVTMSAIDTAFEKIESMLARKVKTLLVIEDNDPQRKSIVELIGDGDVKTTEAANGNDAYALLKKKAFDCMILDLGLPDISGVDFLKKIKDDDTIPYIPVIVYTGKELTGREESMINQYAEKLIIKGTKSAEKLINESTLFLHRIEQDLPLQKRRILQLMHDKETAFHNKTVLIVDDDMRNVYALSNVLEDKGIKTIVAKDGKDGLNRLKESDGVDLVLMDIMMPEMDGYEAMQNIRKDSAYRHLPVIALTAKAMAGDRKKCIEAGANDYLAKPVDTEKLLSMLRVWLYG